MHRPDPLPARTAQLKRGGVWERDWVLVGAGGCWWVLVVAGFLFKMSEKATLCSSDVLLYDLTRLIAAKHHLYHLHFIALLTILSTDKF